MKVGKMCSSGGSGGCGEYIHGGGGGGKTL